MDSLLILHAPQTLQVPVDFATAPELRCSPGRSVPECFRSRSRAGDPPSSHRRGLHSGMMTTRRCTRPARSSSASPSVMASPFRASVVSICSCAAVSCDWWCGAVQRRPLTAKAYPLPRTSCSLRHVKALGSVRHGHQQVRDRGLARTLAWRFVQVIHELGNAMCDESL